MTDLKVTQADIDRAEDFRGVEINESWGLPSLRAAFARHRADSRAELVEALEHYAKDYDHERGCSQWDGGSIARAALARVKGEKA